MTNVLLSDGAIIIYELFIIFIITILIIKFSREKRNYIKSTDISHQRRQHDRLNQKLANIKGNDE